MSDKDKAMLMMIGARAQVEEVCKSIAENGMTKFYEERLYETMDTWSWATENYRQTIEDLKDAGIEE